MSDLISTLPIDEKEMTPDEYALVHPYIKRTVSFMESNKAYIIMGILVFIISMPIFDTLAGKIIPPLGKMPYILAVAKGILIVILVFILSKFKVI